MVDQQKVQRAIEMMMDPNLKESKRAQLVAVALTDMYMYVDRIASALERTASVLEDKTND